MFRTGSPYSPFFTSGLLVTRRGSFPSDPPEPFYFTLRDTSDYRSFLSLDLAESQSLPRKVAQDAVTPSLRIRRSRDSMRTIPSPKPAPSITLPDVPPRLPSISLTPPIRLTPTLVVSRTKAPVDITDLSKRNSTTPSVRKINRSHALARLEGRTNSNQRKPNPIKRNFMSMSDEESEGGDDEFENEPDPRKFALDVINEPEDLVLPPTTLPPQPTGGRFPSSVRTKSVAAASPRKRRTKTKDWFPLKSFIDLQAGDDDSKRFSWRSFIEVARVS